MNNPITLNSLNDIINNPEYKMVVIRFRNLFDKLKYYNKNIYSLKHTLNNLENIIYFNPLLKQLNNVKYEYYDQHKKICYIEIYYENNILKGLKYNSPFIYYNADEELNHLPTINNYPIQMENQLVLSNHYNDIRDLIVSDHT
jgi:hypothetical protein